MTTMIVELYEASKAAGAPEQKAQAVAKALVDDDRQFDQIDGKLAALGAQITLVKWMSGATFAALLGPLLLAGCTTASPQPVPPVPYEPPPYTMSGTSAAVYGAPAPRRTYGTRPSDVALTVVSAPFVLAFRIAVCATSAVVAGPAAAVFAVSDDPRGGFDYLRYGLARNCGPPYVVPVPAAGRDGSDAAGQPRPLIPDADAAVPSPVAAYEPDPGLEQPRSVTRQSSSSVMASP